MKLRALTALVVLSAGLAATGSAYAQAPGSLDSSFGSGGIATLSGDELFGVAVQSDGEVVAVGSNGSMLAERFSAGGQPEASYTGPSGYARAVAMQPDGKIVIAGSNGSAMLIERLNSNLTPDTSFGSGGVVTLFAGTTATGVAIAPDGSIVVVGSAGSPCSASTPNSTMDVASLSSTGAVKWNEALDPFFNNPAAIANAVAIQPNGAIVIAGSEQGSPQNVFFNGVLVRLNAANGSYDGSFGGNAGPGVDYYAEPQSGCTSLNGVAIQNNGQIVVSGASAGSASGNPVAIFARVNSDGSFDSSFGSGGGAQSLSAGTSTNEPVGANGVGIGGGGAVIGAGSVQIHGADFRAGLWAVDSSGSPESSVASNDPAQAQPDAAESCAVAIDPSTGNIVTVGNALPNSTSPGHQPCSGGSSAFVARYTGFGPPPPPPPPQPTTAAPTVTTGSAGSVTSSSATVSGSVNPNGLATSYHFQYGTSTSYGSSTNAGSVAAGSSAVAASAALSGLAPGTTYHYRLVASNADGATNGADKTFKTGSAPPPPPPLKVSLIGLKGSYKTAIVAKQGLSLSVGCRQACTIKVVLTVTAAQARKLGVKVRGSAPVTVASAAGTLGKAGTKKFVLKLSKSWAKALLKQRSVPLTLSVAGTATATRRTTTVKRGISFTR